MRETKRIIVEVVVETKRIIVEVVVETNEVTGSLRKPSDYSRVWGL